MGGYVGALSYLFSFKGRINRGKLWLWVGVSFVIEAACAGAAYIWPWLLYVSYLPRPIQDATPPGLTHPVPLIVYALLLWPNLALAIKRLHDRDKRAVWRLLYWGVPFGLQMLAFRYPYLAPTTIAGQPPVVFWGVIAAAMIGIAVGFLGFLELYCFSGSFGENRFGPDPLGGAQNMSRVFPGEQAPPSGVEQS